MHHNLIEMTIFDAINWGTKELGQFDSPRLEAEVLLAHVVRKDRVWIKTHVDFGLGSEELSKFQDFVIQRVRNTPIAYILGYKLWNDLKIKVTPEVLIPRDETEILTHLIVASLKEANVIPKSILDVGTGSGCISMYLQQCFVRAHVRALDISRAALDVARENAALNNREISFLESDLLSALPDGANFDLIVANLPYVPKNSDLAPEIYQEPEMAIFSGEDGLDHIRRLREELKNKDIKFRQLWLEFLPAQGNSIESIFKDYVLQFHTDVSGEVFFVKIMQD